VGGGADEGSEHSAMRAAARRMEASSSAACGRQGLKFRRNFAEIRRKILFSLVTGKKISVFFEKFRLKIQNSKKIGQNSPKFAEIYRNFGTKFRFR